MISVQTRGLIVTLALGTFLPVAVAELPQTGEYKGSLTVIREVAGPTKNPKVTTTFKAVARVETDGQIRIVYSGDRDPIFGKLREDGANTVLDLDNNTKAVETTARTFRLEYSSPQDDIAGPNGSTMLYQIFYITKLRRVGK